VPSELEILDAFRDALSVPDFAEVLRDDAATDAFVDAFGPCCHPDFRVDMIAGAAGLRQEYSGVDGLVKGWRDWVAPFEAFRIEIENDFAGGGDVYVGFARQTGVLEGGGEVKADAAALFRFENGLLARLEFHMDRAEAMRSAGLA